ncbi:MAG: hypothetical protein A3B73_04415 [Omnitrophica WOR_2 bacterium RIFCSPHIGHO2_02_FULL_63_39]|nr:MAG: hypothetical protein A2Z92_03340 [Omnitrophica WOR_2 bacterium GWA2_63_20]OGX35200.1 MAG: hypothetical protein A3B73_04415 [Omnitrophica WOR_2 bacterium RIFCSPHIGHO2_02_FULL_63_39]OGX48769.1 MAG: hypothetical protein A3G88_05955 [Omnitrophica WOR_2 bacterium RIFCSPLOWO2_12_FULL_63_16]HBQ38518.1 hypothetical protein [Candidatus Omnitrophota bacterium]
MKPTHLKGSLFGGLIGLIAVLLYMFSFTGRVQNYETGGFIYALSSFVVIIPAIVASLANGKLLPIFAVGYWALLGWLYAVSLRRRKLFLLTVGLVHLVGLIAVDLIVRSKPLPSFLGW